jgi:flagellar motor switch protein FliN/FliY
LRLFDGPIAESPPMMAQRPADAVAPSQSGDEQAKVPPPVRACAARRPRPATIEDLPNYCRSLLRIKVPVVVTLAEKKQALSQIMELGPGSIIQFEKSCNEMLDLGVGGRSVAKGEAVKVGDKFGLRISAITPPGERFVPVKGPRRDAR